VPIADLADKTTAGDNPDRAAILEVAHAQTGIADDFYVWQLYVQGNTAVCDVQGSTSARRMLIALARDGGGWKAVYQVGFLDASEAALLKAAPSVTAELAERVDFVVPVEVDPFFGSGADVLVSTGRSAGVSEMAVYAPTRLPEGLTLAGTDNHEYSASAHYASGARRLSYIIIVASDYGEQGPDVIYSNLRFGDIAAFMDNSFNWEGGSGPHLMSGTRGEHYLQGTGISPGMVAAVAESMVRVK
jgi:hypothetical protein